jgi:hypothetical protein
LIWGYFRNLAVAPNVDWQALASVLLNHFLDSRLECDQAALRNRRFANVTFSVALNQIIIQCCICDLELAGLLELIATPNAGVNAVLP